MLLSVIIVNYKVKNLLRKCLNSVEKAAKGIDTEIWVVDNHSNDGSVEMLKTEFPHVNVIANSENKGFSKANNQAIEKSKGEYLLILNPDTEVSPNTFQDCLKFNQSDSECGSIGVRMVDKDGKYLPESKRGFPDFWTIFYLVTKLYKLYPKSPIINNYYLGHMSEDKIYPIDVVAGAFIWVKKDIYNEVGGLDNSYFMYGEDIDLSYKIFNAGYQNYYIGTTTILHHKGESTNKLSVDYINRFYGAMDIYTKKYNPNTYPYYHLLIAIIKAYKKAILYLRLSLIKKH